jgi:hypothetical protein
MTSSSQEQRGALRSATVKKKALLAAASFSFLGLVAISSPAQAEDPFAAGVLKCFHPEARLIQMSFASDRTEASGREVRKGWLKFRDGRSEAAMSFAFESRTQDKDIFVRITPLTDSDITASEPNCYLRDWQRAY